MQHQPVGKGLLRTALASGLLFISFLALAVLTDPAAADVRITEVLIDPVGADAGFQRVEITNLGTSTVDIGGWRICAFFQYRTFPLGVTLAPGERYIVHIREDGVNDANNFFTGALYTLLTKTAGSFALYLPGISIIDFGNAAFIADYMGWGGGFQLRENVATAAGIWPAGDFVTVAPESQSNQLCDPATRNSTAWLAAATSIGAANNCAVPKPNVILSEVLVDPVGPNSGNQKIEIQNLEATPVDLSSWTICFQFLYWPLPAGTVVGAGDFLTIHLGAVGVDDALNKFTGPFFDLSPIDGLGLYLPTAADSEFTFPSKMIDFVQWGAALQPREDVAVAAGLWTAGQFLSQAVGRSLERCSPAPGAASWNQTPDITIGSANSCSPTGVGDGSAPVTRLGRPTPNPLVGRTTLSFELSRAARVRARVLDVRGRVVTELADRSFPAGVSALVWNGKSSDGNALPAGVYLIEVSSPDAIGPGGAPWRATRRVVHVGLGE